MLDDADLVLTAESVHRQHILDDLPQLHRKVFTLGQFEAIIAELPGLSAAASSSPRPASGVRRRPPSTTSPTPTGAGRRPPQQATGTITAMLSVIVPRLTACRRGDR